ncbi:uncharacterized protein LOC142180948 [Nicotiana tabacum]|uniref:Uncharacterized protein LOC142180948 n=1 Tax=Nicotiana tabacum TaxID=4097 RepID=A0AC58UI64_TOBAC
MIAEDEQHITIKFDDAISNHSTYITAVYAKCTAVERKELWERLVEDSLIIDGPWCIRGDFNVIIDPEEKLGGNPHRVHKSLDFINCMDNCGVTNLGFSGPKFTCQRLSKWSREEIGDINDQVSKWEAEVQLLDDIDTNSSTDNSRTKANKVYAEYIQWLSKQESLLKQKTQTKWFEDGDSNTKYFHGLLREKRRRFQLHRIKNHKGQMDSKRKQHC